MMDNTISTPLSQRQLSQYELPLNKTLVVSFSTSKEGIQTTTTCACAIAMRSREQQPKCNLGVCREICPYGGRGWVSDVVDMDNGCSAVTLGRADDGESWNACLVMYLAGKCDSSEVSGKELQFAKRHTPRLMDACPIKMEHMLHAWNPRKSRKGNRK